MCEICPITNAKDCFEAVYGRSPLGPPHATKTKDLIGCDACCIRAQTYNYDETLVENLNDTIRVCSDCHESKSLSLYPVYAMGDRYKLYCIKCYVSRLKKAGWYKYCDRCKKQKRLSFFQRRHANSNRTRPFCIECNNKRTNNHQTHISESEQKDANEEKLFFSNMFEIN